MQLWLKLGRNYEVATWVKTTFSLFTCSQLDQPAVPPFTAEAVGTGWAEDMSQRCYSLTGYHKH
jgi:hypothetical protein